MTSLVEMAPILTVVVIGGTDAWVYVDAHGRAEIGDPVTVVFGSARIETPLAWLVCCLVLWVVSFPLYLVARRQAG